MGHYLGNFYFDPAYTWTYVLVMITFAASLIAQIRVKTTFSKYSGRENKNRLTAEQAAQRVLDYYGVDDVSIQHINGKLTDNYNPSTSIISLSDEVYGSTSIAAIGVACHEAGHAAQHAQGYLPIRIRNAIIPVCNIGNYLGVPLAILGAVINMYGLVYFGLLLYSFIAIFQFATLPVEFNASRRAIKVIEETGMLDKQESRGAASVLKAAAMTYVAAAATVLANVIRFAVMILGGSNRRSN